MRESPVPMTSSFRALALVFLAGGTATAQQTTVLPNPAGEASGSYSLAAGEEGVILLSWIEPVAAGHSFRFSELLEEGWSEPRTIAEGNDFFVNWADRPSMVAIEGDRLAAHWLVRNEKATGHYGYGIRMAHSFDRGNTWREVFSAGLDNTEAYTGFMAFTREPGGFSGAYLTPETVAGEERMTLRMVRFHVDGHPLSDQLLDEVACDCCPLGMATSALGPLVAYRDRHLDPPNDDIRDITVRRRVREVWESDRPVHRDGWRINGCPVNGPAIAASGNTVAVAWFTLATGEPEMRIAFSGNGAEGFTLPTRFDEGAPGGYADMVLLDDGTAAILWLESGDDGGAVRLRRMTQDGLPSESILISTAPAGRDAGVLQMERQNDRLIVAWRDGGVRTASIEIEALLTP